MKLRIEAAPGEIEARESDLLKALLEQLPCEDPQVSAVEHLLSHLSKAEDPLSDQGPLRFELTGQIFDRLDRIYTEEVERLTEEIEAILREV